MSRAVETIDLMTKAIGDATARIKQVNPSKNLVDQISEEEWSMWDRSEELALVASRGHA